MKYKYYVVVNPFDYGEASGSCFDTNENAMQFIKLGIEHSTSGFYIRKYEDNEVEE